MSSSPSCITAICQWARLPRLMDLGAGEEDIRSGCGEAGQQKVRHANRFHTSALVCLRHRVSFLQFTPGVLMQSDPEHAGGIAQLQDCWGARLLG